MFLRKYWLPMSVFIVMIVGVGLYYLQTRPPKPPIIIYKTTEVETPKAKAPVAETPQGGHFHQEVETPQGGHFHQHGSGLAEPHTSPESPTAVPHESARTQNGIEATARQPTEEDKAEAIKRYYQQMGVDPPPKGYTYIMSEPGVPKFDENGMPILLKFGEPLIQVINVQGFVPTREEYEHYQQLARQYEQAVQLGNFAESERIDTEMAELRKHASGELPLATFSIMSTDPNVDMAALERDAARLALERTYAEYRKRGLEYLIPDSFK